MKKGLIGSFMTMALYGGIESLGKYKDPLQDIDIAKEYFLIQSKKSNLSASKRALVLKRYNEVKI